MAKAGYFQSEECRTHLAKVATAHDNANRTALLEHARMGRSVPESGGNGGVVWVTPTQIFARYNLDEFGRPLPGTPQD